MKDNKVSLIDINNPDHKGQILDPWLGLVLQYANGQRTIEDLSKDLSGRYNDSPPANLEATIHSAVTRLVDLRFIVLTKEATDLPYYLSLPYEQMDIEKAKKSLEEDNVKLD
ncbi:MAG: PqqD family peptide modification chaperone [Cyclobacteriaceae bacterium]|nr:PqqD family peptide modification chaperone [Cyclobacteriaceae bacterium]